MHVQVYISSIENSFKIIFDYMVNCIGEMKENVSTSPISTIFITENVGMYVQVYVSCIQTASLSIIQLLLPWHYATTKYNID